MVKLLNLSSTPYVDDTAVLHPTGEYFAILTDYNAQIFFIDEAQETILILKYLLISCDSYCVYNFTETHTMDLHNPRFTKLYAYLQKLFSEDELDFEKNLVPTFEKIKLRWEFLGCYAYLIISEREYLFNPYKEEERSHRIDEILSKARDLLNASDETPFASLEAQTEKSPPGDEMIPLVEENAREEASNLMEKTMEVNNET